MSTRIETRFTREYGIDHPIALAGMGFVGSPELAIAVCEGGGLGAVGVGPLPAEAVRGLISVVRSATVRPFNVNMITFLVREEQVRVCIEERVPIVSFHWGHPPRDVIDRLHGAGVKVWEQVGSVEAARQAAELGIDLVIAQGSEAGGHNYGSLPTFVLVPHVVQAIAPLPVLAAGGIVSGRQLAAALVLGAVGGWIGTRFVASKESSAHPSYKQRLLDADGTQTRLTSVYGPDMPHFNPMRVLDVGLAHEFAGREDEAPKDLASQPIIATTTLAGATVPVRRFDCFVPTETTDGQIEEMPLLAGQGVGAVREVLSARDIVGALVEEAISALSETRAMTT